MKIVEIIPSLQKRAGAENLLVDLSCEMKKNGNDVQVVCLYNGINSEYKQKLRKYGVMVFYLNKKKGLDIACAKELNALLLKLNPQIVHLHLNCIITYYFAFGLKIQKWKLLQTCHNLAKKDANFVNRILRSLYMKKSVLTTIAISPRIKNSIIKCYKSANNENVPVIYNGIELRHINDSIEKTYDLIMVARFSKQKNHTFLVKCVADYLKNNPDIKICCLGDGPLFKKIQKMIKREKINLNISLKGSVDDIYPYLLASKIFVLPSLYEGNPISILEAMNVGLPIIASKVGGIPDIVLEGENGFLFKKNSKKEFLDCLIKCLEPSFLKDVASINKKRVEMYSIQKCYSDYIKVFKEYEK